MFFAYWSWVLRDWKKKHNLLTYPTEIRGHLFKVNETEQNCTELNQMSAFVFQHNELWYLIKFSTLPGIRLFPTKNYDKRLKFEDLIQEKKTFNWKFVNIV